MAHLDEILHGRGRARGLVMHMLGGADEISELADSVARMMVKE